MSYVLDLLAGVARVFVGPGDDPAVGERLDEAARVPLAGVLAGLGVHGLNTVLAPLDLQEDLAKLRAHPATAGHRNEVAENHHTKRNRYDRAQSLMDIIYFKFESLLDLNHFTIECNQSLLHVSNFLFSFTVSFSFFFSFPFAAAAAVSSSSSFNP